MTQNRRFNAETTQVLLNLARALIDQERARVIVPPERPGPGHWFGGGNLAAGPDGALYLSGRFRNYGDSRTGLGKGERGKELAIYRRDDQASTFTKVLSFSKDRLSPPNRPVLSIEGSHLLFHDDGVTLFVSTEKDVPYPPDVDSFRKAGTGVWSIDRLDAPTVEALAVAPVTPFIESSDPEHLHVKDPFAFIVDGKLHVGYCTHPFSWASSNTGYLVDGDRILDTFPRGPAWDVAIARMTCYAPVPPVGILTRRSTHFLCFYDGGECVRQLDEHPTAVRRPRGYSCEEIGGLAVADATAPLSPQRISTRRAEFVSPRGTGCSRYVDVLFTGEWAYATWQQSQDDQSQPLVMHALPMDEVVRILS